MNFETVFIALFVLAFIVWPFTSHVVKEQRWYKKLLFYYFPRFLRPLSHKLKPINIYYKKLTKEERKRFEWRVYYFIDTTDIEFRQFKPTQFINHNAVRYLIASVATQMSLFLTEDCFDAFHKIIIYPDRYYSPITKQYHHGETNPAAGYIVLSWKRFSEGFKNSNDGINLLMHELAHALWLEDKLFDYEIFEPGALHRYELTAKLIMAEMNGGDDHFFRKYALTNKEEFFAVSVENFFERPAAFKAALPELYSNLAQLLRQDPLVLA